MNPTPPDFRFRPPRRRHIISLAVAGIALVLALATVAADGTAATTPQAAAGTGSIEGRIFNARSGTVIENARVSVDGTARITFTDADGNYRLSQVPAGTVQVRVFFTGFPPHTEGVVVQPGGTVRRDITLTAAAEKIVELDEFVVEVSREMDAAAIAINEQRFAPNVKNVVSTDEFGAIAEGNVAEFLRHMPGITVNLNNGSPVTISIDGAPSANTPVTLSGIDLPNPTNTGAVEVGFFNLNNVARVEVNFSPTPESRGSALAGSVNMIPRSAFERTKPTFKGSAYVMMRDDEITLRKVPSLYRDPRRVVHPGFDLSWIVPVNKRIGFTLATGASTQYSHAIGHTSVWRGVNAATDGNAFPHTTPGRPYLSAYTIRDAPTETFRRSLGVTLDLKLSPYDRVALSFQYTSFDRWSATRSLQFNPGRIVAGTFSPTFSQGVAGAGNLVSTSGNGTIRANRTYMPTLNWWHNGPVWKAEAAVGRALGVTSERDTDRGMLLTVVSRRTGVTIDFDRITDTRPEIITVLDNTRRSPIDPFRLTSYSLASVSSNTRRSPDLNVTAFANLRREFAWRVPVALKAGIDFRKSEQDLKANPITYTYRGSTIPGSAAPFVDPTISQRTGPYGFPRIEFADYKGTLDYFKANPELFTFDESARHRSLVNGSRHVEEAVSAAYVRGDLAFLDRRLLLVGGLRVEQTNIDAEGPLTDPTRNVRRDAGGRPVLDTAGRPVPVTTNPLESLQLTLVERGSRTEKEYLRLFPSVNASYNIRENLIGRVAIYTSVGPPGFNHYAGGVTLPNTENLPSPGNRITVNNAGIKPWMANTTKLRLEYYFEGVGQLSAGVFRRDYRNFFGNTVFPATAEFLALYGLDPDIYGAYEVSTQYNLPGTVRTEGFDVSYKQALAFLPAWARGIQVFGNWSSRKMQARNLGALGFNDIPHSGSWGISLTRPRFNVRLNVSFRAAQLRGEVTGTGIEPETYNYTPSRNTIDVLGEVNVWKRLAVFGSLRNVADVPDEIATFGPSTPAHARLRSRERYGSLWTFGVKGTF